MYYEKTSYYYYLLAIQFYGACVPDKQRTDTLGNRLIYDDDLNITWYDFTTPTANTWQNQRDWASGLLINFDGTMYDGWRLPKTVDVPSVWGFDGTTSAGYNITTSEMGHLFYTELGNRGQFDTTNTFDINFGLKNIGEFQNLTNTFYWSETDVIDRPASAWYFHFHYGYQPTSGKPSNFFAIAVRNGDVAPVPEPSTFMLMGIGIVGLVGAGIRRRFKKTKE